MTHRIVVVEDEKDIQSLIVEELEDEGYKVATADNGKEGLEIIETFKPHLILSDITMPIMNGHEMLTEFREKYPQMRSVPLIFLSALADRRHVIEGKKLGVDDYITKPIDFELLLVTVQARLREVERMTKEKEEQMVQLYTRMAGAKKQSSKDPALIVTNQWANITSLQNKLKELGVPYLTQYRGSQLDDYLKQKRYSAIIMTDMSDDINAKLAMFRSDNIQNCTAPKFLVIENMKPNTDKTYWRAFNQVSGLDEAPNMLAEHF